MRGVLPCSGLSLDRNRRAAFYTSETLTKPDQASAEDPISENLWFPPSLSSLPVSERPSSRQGRRGRLVDGGVWKRNGVVT